VTVARRGGVAGVAQALLDALPQTQCQRCAYPDCASYAQAIASGVADINQWAWSVWPKCSGVTPNP